MSKQLTQKQLDAFNEASLPLIKWLCENKNPHTHVLVTANSAELLESHVMFLTDEFIKD